MIRSTHQAPPANNISGEAQSPQPQSPRGANGKPADPTVGLPAYSAQAVRNTTLAFVLPTLASGVLPPHLRSMVYVPAGVTYAHLRTSPQAIGFQPRPSRPNALAATALGLSPFLPLLSLQTHFAQSDLKVGRLIQQVWAGLADRLPASVASALRNYPINQLLARASAQMGAAALGSVLSHAYLTQAQQATPVRNAAPTHSALPNPDIKALACLSGAALFSIPALVASPHMATLVPGWSGLPPVARTAVVTTLLIGAAVATSAVAMSQPADSTTDNRAQWPDVEQLPTSPDLIDAAVASIAAAAKETPNGE
ncbi:MAG: hypothetical protein KF871_13680 [Hydrogenophaga sp.]|uniref:hypothetical protein n=1 Tax=Hydrogenophaga sp. TaxID=1904254 RepID=UPI001DEBCB00|nr:hypothetical protein [Hydrogenophaga sp.]MBX3610936.1 hypothetical protein [Hydrogenophaga sp.]